MTREEAIQNIKKFIGTSDTLDESIFTLCPELKESEDERIRKAIVTLIKDLQHYSTNYAGVDPTEMLAWLEKQKEQKSLNISAASEWLKKHVCIYMNSEYNEFHKCVEYDGSIDKERLINDFEEAMQKEQEEPQVYKTRDGETITYSETDGYKVCDEKQKEQPQEELVYRLNGLMQEYIKEGEDDAEKEHRFKCYQLFWDALEDADFFEQKKQKPAEFDEYKIIKKHITEDMLSSEVNKRLTECGWYVTDEKPAEWSEEDEAMRDNIIRVLSCFYGTSECESNPSLSTLYPAYQREIDWLKSLYPRKRAEGNH